MKERNGILILVLASLIWGVAFVSQKSASSLLGPFTFNGIRMMLGALALIPFSIRGIKSGIKRERRYLKIDIIGGVICGFLLFLASFLQQKGIENTTAGKAGFITSLYILIVPILSFVTGKRPSLKVWFSVLIGLLGAFLMSYNGASGFSRGDLWVLISAFVFSFHILAIDRFTKKLDAISLSMFQFFFCSIFNLILLPFFESPTISIILDAYIQILYSGVMSCAIAYTLQTYGQRFVESTKASLALSLESVFALLAGLLILNERLVAREWIGVFLVFSSVILSEVNLKRRVTSV